LPILQVPGTKEAEERIKWEAQHTGYGPPGRPYVYREFPLMIHKAGKALDAAGLPKLGAAVIIETKTVANEAEERQWLGDGFHRNPAEAVLMYEKGTVEVAKLAAEINYEVKNKLSPLAVAEVEAAQAAHAGHLPSVPETPIVRRTRIARDGGKKLGRPRKAAPAAGE
jgi:hypothetical protein